MKRSALLVCALLSTLPIAAQAQVYQWTEKDGTVHYSDVPPLSSDVKAVQHGHKAGPTVIRNEPIQNATGNEGNDEMGAGTPPTSSPPIAVPAKSRAEIELEEREQRQKAATKAEQAAAAEEQRAQKCEQSRRQLTALMDGHRIVRPAADGSREFLSDEERATEINRTQEMVDAFCR
jgi:hypothetical protein